MVFVLTRSGSDVDNLTRGSWRRNGIAILLESLEVELDGFLDRGEYFSARFTNCNATRQIGDVCPERGWALFDNDEVSHSDGPYFFSPACFKVLLSVPGGMSTFGLPATATLPGQPQAARLVRRALCLAT